jgi:hypothetical protein
LKIAPVLVTIALFQPSDNTTTPPGMLMVSSKSQLMSFESKAMMSPRLSHVPKIFKNNPYVIKWPQSIRMQVSQSFSPI